MTFEIIDDFPVLTANYLSACLIYAANREHQIMILAEHHEVIFPRKMSQRLVSFIQ